MKKNNTPYTNRPILAAAVYCERTIEDKDGVVSVIRIVDTINIKVDATSLPQDFPSKDNPIAFTIEGLLTFKSVGSHGKHTLKLVLQGPSGKKSKIVEREIGFKESPLSGFNLRLNNHILAASTGLYWTHVYLDGKRMASMPLQINLTFGPLISKPEGPESKKPAKKKG